MWTSSEDWYSACQAVRFSAPTFARSVGRKIFLAGTPMPQAAGSDLGTWKKSLPKSWSPH